MEHQEAIEMMASERYLLDELTPEVRDAYEDHLFGCAECASDVRFGAVFLDRAKVVLPEMKAETRASGSRVTAGAVKERRDWMAWLRPAVSLRPALMVPVFASLLAVIGYQNFAVIPGLEMAAMEPQILPQATVLHGATRGGIPVVHADLAMGSSLLVELPANASYASYRFEIYNSKSKLIWSRTMAGAGVVDGTVPLWLPGRVKQDSYRLSISGTTATGESVTLPQQLFELK